MPLSPAELFSAPSLTHALSHGLADVACTLRTETNSPRTDANLPKTAGEACPQMAILPQVLAGWKFQHMLRKFRYLRAVFCWPFQDHYQDVGNPPRDKSPIDLRTSVHGSRISPICQSANGHGHSSESKPGILGNKRNSWKDSPLADHCNFKPWQIGKSLKLTERFRMCHVSKIELSAFAMDTIGVPRACHILGHLRTLT